MTEARSPELVAGYKALATGAWIPGRALMGAIAAAIAPGEAQRKGRTLLVNPDVFSTSAQIEKGRHNIAVERVRGQVVLGAWETRPAVINRAHWQGEAEWQIRDRFPGAMSIPEYAKHVGIDAQVIRHWIKIGVAPEPPRTQPNGHFLLTPDLQVVYTKIAGAYPGKRGRWPVDPRSFWQSGAETHACPHCGQPVTVVVALRKVEPEGAT